MRRKPDTPCAIGHNVHLTRNMLVARRANAQRSVLPALVNRKDFLQCKTELERDFQVLFILAICEEVRRGLFAW